MGRECALLVNGYARMGAVRDFATVNSWSPPRRNTPIQRQRSRCYFCFLPSGNKLVGTCADVQTVHGAKSSGFSRWFGPFSGPGKKSAGMQPSLLVTTGRRHNVDGHLDGAGQIVCRSKFNAPYLASIVHRLHLGSFAGASDRSHFHRVAKSSKRSTPSACR